MSPLSISCWVPTVSDSLQTMLQAFPLPSLTFQLAMFPSVIVGDMAGIVRFCAARDFEALRKPSWRLASSLIPGGELKGRSTNLEKGHCEATTGLKASQHLYMLLQGRSYPFRRCVKRHQAPNRIVIFWKTELWIVGASVSELGGPNPCNLY